MWAGGSLERAICKWQNCQTQILYECVNIISMLVRMMILEEKIAKDWSPGIPKIEKICVGSGVGYLRTGKITQFFQFFLIDYANW